MNADCGSWTVCLAVSGHFPDQGTRKSNISLFARTMDNRVHNNLWKAAFFVN